MLFFLAQAPVEADTIKIAPIAADSLVSDSLAQDTLITYKIPEIIDMTDPVSRTPGSIAAFAVGDEDLFSSDAFAVSPFLVKGGLLYRRGCEPYRIPVMLNTHPLTGQLTGYLDVNRIAVQFVDRITVNGDNIDLQTLINHYDRPYSHLRFMALGKTTLYNINFTRSITNEMGFYLAGIYRRARVLENSEFAYETTNSFYANYYWNNFFKSRVDFVYNNSAIGESKKTELIDASLVMGRGVIKTNIFFNYDRFDFDSSTIRAADAFYGATVSGLHDLNFARLGWHFTARGDNARIQHFPSHPYADQFEYFIQSGVTATKEWGRCQGILNADLDFVGRDGLFPAPGIKLSYNPFDSMFLFVDVNRGYRIPTVIERKGFDYCDWDPYVRTRGSSGLAPETFWRQEAGGRFRNCIVTAYKIDYQNYIKIATSPIWEPQNIPNVGFLGVEASLDLPLIWGFRLGFGGDYHFRVEFIDGPPKYNAAAGLTWLAERGRARFKIFGLGRYLGPRSGGGDADTRPVFTLGGLIRFVTLTGCLKVENLLDDKIVDFPVPERDISLSIKWEFFN